MTKKDIESVKKEAKEAFEEAMKDRKKADEIVETQKAMENASLTDYREKLDSQLKEKVYPYASSLPGFDSDRYDKPSKLPDSIMGQAIQYGLNRLVNDSADRLSANLENIVDHALPDKTLDRLFTIRDFSDQIKDKNDKEIVGSYLSILQARDFRDRIKSGKTQEGDQEQIQNYILAGLYESAREDEEKHQKKKNEKNNTNHKVNPNSVKLRQALAKAAMETGLIKREFQEKYIKKGVEAEVKLREDRYKEISKDKTAYDIIRNSVKDYAGKDLKSRQYAVEIIDAAHRDKLKQSED